MRLATCAASSKGIFEVAANSSNQTSKYMPLINLSFLDVYDTKAPV